MYSRFPLALLLVCASIANAGELKPDTLRAWEAYLALIDASMHPPPTADAPFLLLDKGPDTHKALQRGAFLVSQQNRTPSLAISNALIHDWVGAVFIPNATVQGIITLSRDYDKYPTWYAPTVVRAQLLSSHDNIDCFTVDYLRRVLFVTAILQIEYNTQYVELDANRWYSTARSTRIQEIDKSEDPDKRKLLPDDNSGYVWRIYTLTRYEERDHGVYVEQESVALSRPIPASLRWLVEPVVRRLAKDLLKKSLQNTKDAVLSSLAK